MLLRAILTLATLALIGKCFADNPTNLTAVIIIHRHGDRTPTGSFPKDPYGDDSYWPDGWGQLTMDGKLRMHKLGKFFRKRYENFLSNSPRETYPQSSESSRCIESVQLILSGLYPPKDRWIWNQELHWQPIAVKIRPAIINGMLMNKFNCPNADKEIKRIRSSDPVLIFTRQHDALIGTLATYSGMDIKDIYKAKKVISAMKIQRQVGYTQPVWFTDEILEEMQQIHGHAFHFDTSTREIQKLKTGLLFKEIKRILHSKANRCEKKNEKMKKFFLFSTHDTKIAAVLNALRVFNRRPPPFGCSIIFELYTDSDKHFVKSYYLNETETENVNLLRFPFCGDKDTCTLEQFSSYVDGFVPSDWKKECGLSDKSIDRAVSEEETNAVIDTLTCEQEKIE